MSSERLVGGKSLLRDRSPGTPNTDSTFQDKLEDNGYKFMTTFQVYRMLWKCESDDIRTDDIREN